MDPFEMFLGKTADAKVIDASSFVPIDLSENSKSLAGIDIYNPENFEDFITEYLSGRNADIAYGGYNEQRSLYRNSAIFDDAGSGRDIHIGLDLWAKAGTPILAALDGKVHSFDYNTGNGNYGPTIILEHQIDGHRFYTLYGHLSLESIDEIEIGDMFRKGQPMATLGDAAVNGNYAPHLHFQIIREMGDYFGHYPGVCSKVDMEFYLENCPNPNILLKLNTTYENE